MFIALLFLAVGASASFDAYKARDFLVKYGYLETEPAPPHLSIHGKPVLIDPSSSPSFKEALQEFQSFYHLPTDGKLNKETVALMQKSRCGLSDSFSIFDGWTKRTLTWYFYRGSNDLFHLTTQAFNFWQKYSNLKFIRKFSAEGADIVLSLQYPDPSHLLLVEKRNCSYQLGNGILGHAFYPDNDEPREIHLDMGTDWYMGLDAAPQGKASLFRVLLHEIGHAIGIQHSDDTNSVMYAYYQGDTSIADLPEDDKKAVHYLYGNQAKPTSTPQPTTPPPPTPSTQKSVMPPPPPPQDLCHHPQQRFKFVIVNHRMYVLDKYYMWSVNLKDFTYERPILLKDWFPFIPDEFEIQSVHQEPSGDIVVVINKQIYVIDSSTLQLKSSNFPISLEYLVPRASTLNAIVNSYTGQTFVFYDGIHYLESSQEPAGYLKPGNRGRISEGFPGVPPAIDSAFRYTNGLLYFFKNDTVYEYNEFTQTVVRAMPWNLEIFNIQCPNEALLDQLQDILSKLNKMLTQSLNTTCY